MVEGSLADRVERRTADSRSSVQRTCAEHRPVSDPLTPHLFCCLAAVPLLCSYPTLIIGGRQRRCG